jgi:N-acetylglucosamine malate deacetylase 2
MRPARPLAAPSLIPVLPSEPMRILYIFPHPDDESFGPAAVMAQQRDHGHDVHLLSLTRGGATKKRFDLGLTVDAMGDVRYREMLDMARTLDLTGMTVLDLPDSGLKEMDPRKIEHIVCMHIDEIRPDVIVSYPVHGISGFHDHLVMHAVVKRVFIVMCENGASYLRRLAFYTLAQESLQGRGSSFRLNASKPEEIDCVIDVEPGHLDAMHRALDCYGTYQDVITASGVREIVGRRHYFEIFQERHDPPLGDLCAGLRGH